MKRMSKKGKGEKLIIGLSLAVFSCGVFNMKAEAAVQKWKMANVTTCLDAGISVMNESLVWVTRTVNGVKYKRLYSATTGKWLTDWIRCS